MDKRGLFWVLEGIDGCGKTAIAELLAKKIGNTWVTKEPTISNKKIADILQRKKIVPNPLEFQKLYIQDRQKHTKKIKTALAKGKTVICQRYAMSTYAYGTAFGVAKKDLAHNFLEPDITFLLDLPAKIAMQRIASRKQGREYFEKAQKLAKIRRKYNALAREKIFGKIIKINAKPKPEVIVKKILWHFKLDKNL